MLELTRGAFCRIGIFILCLFISQQAVAGANGPAFVLRAETSLEKFFPDSAKESWIKAGAGDSIAISACRGESESLQIVIISLEPLKNLRWKTVSKTISDDCISVCPVGYVDVPKSSLPRWVKHDDEEIITGLWPDPLMGLDSLDSLAAEQVQPLWVTVDVGETLRAGEHKFSITVSADGAGGAKVDVTLTVRDFALPATPTFKTCFWYSTGDIKGYYLPDSAEETWAIESRFIKTALDRRITPINLDILVNLVSITYEPATKKYIFDFSNFKRYVRLLKSHRRKGNLVNIAGHGTTYGLGLWGVKIKEGDTIKPNKGRFERKKMTPEYRDFLRQYLKAAGAVVSELGVRGETYMGFIDEPGPKVWDAVRWVYPVLKEVLPDVPTVTALNYLPSITALDKEIEIKVPGMFSAFNSNTLPKWEACRKNAKREWWGYVCGKTSNIDYQAIHHRVWPWICRRYDLKGFLYWGIVNWDASMWRPENAKMREQLIKKDPKERWPYKAKWMPVLNAKGVAGDGYLLYPGPEGQAWSSIRLDNIRDGVEDYEYFVILKKRADALAKKDAENPLVAEARKLLDLQSIIIHPEQYLTDPAVYHKRRDAVGSLIEKIGLKLGGTE